MQVTTGNALTAAGRCHVAAKVTTKRPTVIPDEPVDPDEAICSECRKINLDEIFGRDLRRVNDRKRRRPLGDTDQKIQLRPDDSNGECQLCQFFFPGRNPNRDCTQSGSELCIVRAKTHLGAPRASGIVDSTALIVRPESRLDEPVEERIILEDRSQEPNQLSARRLEAKANITLVAEWLAFCDKHHSACKEPDLPIPVGLRVLDCMERTILTWDRIPDPGKRSVALSYVWGASQGLSATSQESASVLTGARSGLDAVELPKLLPRTIQDALSLTQSLGCRYLWVDRYCILQDDAMAKHLQLQGMDIIYQQAYFTIIAAAGDNPHHGLPGVRDTPRKAQTQCTVGSRTLLSVPLVKCEILNSTWNSRGWTYQEGLLSRRRIVFTQSQVYYQCNGMHCLEGIRAPLESLHVRDKSRMSDHVNMARVFPLLTVGKQWHVLGDLIGEYLGRSLTFESDVFDAFRGILAAHERRFSVEVRIVAAVPIAMGYLAEDSPWRPEFARNLINCMAWFFRKGKGKSRILKFQRRPGFPSWTWLGWKPSREAVPITLRRYQMNHNIVSDARFEYADQLVLSWEEEHDLIMKRESQGQIPCFLHIRGSTLQVQVDADGELTSEDDLMRHPRYEPDDPNRESWRDMANWTRETYSPAAPFPLTFTLLAIRQKTGIDIEFMVLYRPLGCAHFYRIDLLIYPWLNSDPRSSWGVWGALGLWPIKSVKIG